MNTGLDARDYGQCHCLAARRHAREITRIYDRYLRPYGLRATQFSVLAALSAGDAVPLSRLADFLGMERTTLTRSVAVLERRGWIQSDASADARVRPIRLTTSGRRKLQVAEAGWKAAQKLTASKTTDSPSKPTGD
jgi:DNA-binding MarR family transcriptional regulator